MFYASNNNMNIVIIQVQKQLKLAYLWFTKWWLKAKRV